MFCSFKKTFLAALCSDKPPGDERTRKAYENANVSPDRKKHIKFQVRSFLLLLACNVIIWNGTRC